MSREDQLKKLIVAGKIEEAKELAKRPTDYEEAEGFVETTMPDADDRTQDAPQDVIDAALEGFEVAYTRETHGFWVHSLSHFTGDLWKRRLMEWIRRLNTLALKGTSERLDDRGCCRRLISDFGKYAQWHDDPSQLGYSANHLTWVQKGMCDRAMAQIRASPFVSEVAFLRWQLDEQQLPRGWDSDAQLEMRDIAKIRAARMRLADLGEDVSEIIALEKRLLSEQIEVLRDHLNAATNGFDIKRLNSGLGKREALLREYT